jgi:hypothetical protein
MADEKKPAAQKAASQSVVTTADDVSGRVPAGAKVVVKRDEPSLDPELKKARDEERKALDEVKIDTTRPEPSIDDELVKARDAEIKAAEKYNKQHS